MAGLARQLWPRVHGGYPTITSRFGDTGMTRRIPRIWAVLAIVTIALFGAILMLGLYSAWTFIRGFASNPCEETVIGRCVSPDKHKEAMLLEVDCGATTDFARHVRILSARNTGTGHPPPNVAVAQGRGIRSVYWKSSSLLVIVFDSSDATFFERKREWNGTQVQYLDVHGASGSTNAN